jgi:hypothetical protein
LDIADAQHDMRTVYAGGFHGQLVAGSIWLLAAGAAVVVSHGAGIVVLLAGGALILPLTMLLLKVVAPHHFRRAIRWFPWRCRSRSRSRWGCW